MIMKQYCTFVDLKPLVILTNSKFKFQDKKCLNTSIIFIPQNNFKNLCFLNFTGKITYNDPALNNLIIK